MYLNFFNVLQFLNFKGIKKFKSLPIYLFFTGEKFCVSHNGNFPRIKISH